MKGTTASTSTKTTRTKTPPDPQRLRYSDGQREAHKARGWVLDSSLSRRVVSVRNRAYFTVAASADILQPMGAESAPLGTRKAPALRPPVLFFSGGRY